MNYVGLAGLFKVTQVVCSRTQELPLNGDLDNVIGLRPVCVAHTIMAHTNPMSLMTPLDATTLRSLYRPERIRDVYGSKELYAV